MAYKTPEMNRAARNDNYMRIHPRWIMKIGTDTVETRADYKDRVETLAAMDKQDLYKQAYAHDKKYPNIDESEDTKFEKLKKTGKQTWSGGDIYTMDVKDDQFIHFTTIENALKILKDKKLSSGGNQFSSFAVSTTYGVFQPGVQTHGNNYDEAILFTTDEAPIGENYAEEVTWKGGVKFKTAKHISFHEAMNTLKSTPETLPNPDDDAVVYNKNLNESADKDYITVYHGTMNKKVPAIKSKGLESPTGYHNAEWFMVSTDFNSALFHGTPGSEGDSVPVIEFKVPVTNVKWEGDPYFWPEHKRNDNSSWFSLKQPLSSEYIVKVHEVDYNKYLQQKQKGF